MENLCKHCALPSNNFITKIENDIEISFCCNGCLTVYNILSTNGLKDYYKLKEASDDKKRIEYKSRSYNYLDDDSFQQEYLKEKNGSFYLEFFVEGIHCLACLWLLEKLHEFVPSITSSHLNISTNTLRVYLASEFKLSEVAKKINELGYIPHPILDNNEQVLLEKKENQKDLIRVAVSFACAGNIMLYSLAIYTGASNFFEKYFNLFSFLCYFPVVFYCSIPFYKNFKTSLVTKKLSIDIPIVASIVITFVMGVYSLINDGKFFYFDSMATLVFLLLSSRYVLKKIQQKAMSSQKLSSLYANQSVIKMNLQNQEEEEILNRFVKVGDIIKVKAQEMIPIDGIIKQGESYINNSLLTGEVTPILRKANQDVFMGAINLDQDLLIVVTKTIEKSRLGLILAEIERGWNNQTSFSNLSERISERFVYIVFSLTSLFFIYFYWTMGLEIAIERSLTLLIITCPCAVALSTPLVFILGLSVLAKKGIFVKNENSFERLIKSTNIFFDKTGTLTEGKFNVTNINYKESDNKHFYLQTLYSLESRSSHPIAKAIIHYLEVKHNNIDVMALTEFKEMPGRGVEAFIGKDKFSVRAAIEMREEVATEIGLYKNDLLQLQISLEDDIKPNILTILEKIRSLGISTKLLSGDNIKVVSEVGTKLNFKNEDIFYEKTPEEKREIVLQYNDSVMVGDGINDAAALQAASLGIAVKGTAEVSLRACDIYLSQDGVEYTLKLINISKKLISIIKKNFFFSFCYNLIGIYLAFFGLVSPVIAAILMPISSITVIFGTLFSIHRLKKYLV